MNGAVTTIPAERFKHGTRSRYVKGCRCAPCRASNAAYYHLRQAAAKERLAEFQLRERDAEMVLGPAPTLPSPQLWTAPDGTVKPRFYARACPGVDGPCPTSSHLRKDSKGGLCGGCRQRLAYSGLVSAERARAHLLELSAAGVGRRAVAAASDVGATILAGIRIGRVKQIRAGTERRILAVDTSARADASLVDSRDTWKAVRQLRRWGWTLGRISQEALGNEMPALQLVGDKVLARTELAVKQLLERERQRRDQRSRAHAAVSRAQHRCPRCGKSHRDDPTALAWCLENLHVPVDALEASA
jgi:hypothetical protein